MVNLFRRMRKLRTKILNIRIGPGAAILPTPETATSEFPAITRLHLTYAQKIYNGHQGARHFWRQCLPRLKFHNPALPITVKQTTTPEEQRDIMPTLTIYFAERASNAASLNDASKEGVRDEYAPKAEDAEKTALLNLRDLDWERIWGKVKLATGAQEVAATKAEEEEVKKLAQMREKAGVDRARNLAIRQARKDQERMLQEAKGEVEKLRQV